MTVLGRTKEDDCVCRRGHSSRKTNKSIPHLVEQTLPHHRQKQRKSSSKTARLAPPRPRPNKGLKKGVRGKVGGDWWSGFFGERLRYCGPGPRPWRKGQEGLPDRAAGAGKPEAAVPAPRRRRLRPGPPPTGNRSPGEAHRLLGAEAVEFGGGRGAEAGAEVGALCPRVRPPCLGPAAKGPGGHGCEAPPTLLQTRTA